MIVPYIYYKFDNVIDSDTIDKILQLGESNQWTRGLTNNENDPNKSETRTTDVIWNNEQWLYDIFWPYMEHANKEGGWNLNITCAESFQLGRFLENGYHSTHMDCSGFNIANNPESVMHGTVRKLSMVCWLNEDFEGGEFKMHRCVMPNDGVIKPTTGTIVFFPAWFMHEVAPIIKGTRYSLVTWFRGPPLI